MKTSRIIFHIDMNCFFASCEIAQNENLIGKPVVVAHDDPLQRGLILSPSYEARRYGIKTTMKVRDAFKLCKEIIVVEPDMRLYSEYSSYFYKFLLTLTEKVEMASIDEAFIDMTEYLEGKNALEVAEMMQKYLLENYKLPCSIGIAPNKFLAKMASDMKKPLGITILRKREIDKYLWPLPISDMMGIGKKTTPKLLELGIDTIGKLANYKDIDKLKKVLGLQSTLALMRLANGIDDSNVEYMGRDLQSSVSNAHTFDVDIYEEKVIKNTLKVICGTISYRLDQSGQCGKTVGLIIKYSGFESFNKSKGLEKPIYSRDDIYDIIEDLFDDNYRKGIGVRQVTVYLQRLSLKKKEAEQISIFDNLNELEKEEEVKKILNQVKEKFGSSTIKKGYYSYDKKD